MTKKIIKKESGETKKSKLQNRYDKLLSDIDKKKKQHQNFTEGLRKAVPLVISELQPLAKEEAEWHIKKLVRLDEIVDEIIISKTKKEIFVSYILEEICLFLTSSHPDNEELKNLYQKYAKEEFLFNRKSEQVDYEEKKQSIFKISLSFLLKKNISDHFLIFVFPYFFNSSINYFINNQLQYQHCFLHHFLLAVVGK